ncbi:MAG: HlyD family efflux transporter periplasmic adaptor subunit, partial [Pseudomonadota bacterium]
QSALDERNSVAGRRSQLTIRAVKDGIVRNVPVNLAVGQYVSPQQRLAILVSQEALDIVGFVPAEELRRLENVDTAIFIADEPELPKIRVAVSGFEPPANGDDALERQLDINGGRIISEAPTDGGEPNAKKPHYRVATQADVDTLPDGYRDHEVRGVMRVWPEPESFGVAIVRRVAGVLIRESGF